MHDLEYTSLIMDIVFGFICTTLGLLHFFDVGKSIEKISGLIGLITGAIIAIITCIYVGYSASLFNNGVVRGLYKLYSNKAYLKWEDGKYVHNYDEDNSGKIDFIEFCNEFVKLFISESFFVNKDCIKFLSVILELLFEFEHTSTGVEFNLFLNIFIGSKRLHCSFVNFVSYDSISLYIYFRYKIF